MLAAQRGTQLHQLAFDLIRLGVPLPKTTATLNSYVNDVLGFKMVPEQILYYSMNCFGTADALSFRDNLLRVFDLKTGINPANVEQLQVYVALFCLEYGLKPMDIQIELRIYQNDDVVIWSTAEDTVDPGDIMHIMEQIKLFDKTIIQLSEEALA